MEDTNQEHQDLEVPELLEKMNELIERGCEVWVKYTCENCGERVTSNTPNAFFTEGWVHDDCGFKSFPKKFGLMIITKFGGDD